MNPRAQVYILRVLKTESIRRVDGRWSIGFVDRDELEKMIAAGDVEVCEYGGMDFVRLPKNGGKP